ncbi:hypothetical protein MMC31_005277, partial [Peltigera leucophlebia]|nr:hypothetical protein [Peltigera leucophlebia]
MDGLSGAASIIAIIEVCGKVISLCHDYFQDVKHATQEMKEFHTKVSNVKFVLEDVQQLFDKLDKTQLLTAYKLSDNLKENLLLLQGLMKKLELGKTKAMKPWGVRALVWPFSKSEIIKHIESLCDYQQVYILALQVDTTRVTHNLNKKMDLFDEKILAFQADTTRATHNSDKKIDLIHEKIDNLSRRMDLVDVKTDNSHQKINAINRLPFVEQASFNSYKEEHNAKCLKDTRVELRHDIENWANDGNGKPIFWLNGMAGTGKSTIARTVAESFAQRRQLGASFFFKKHEDDCSSASKFFTTIARDLMTHIPGLTSNIANAINADPTIAKMGIKGQFEELILQPLNKTRQTNLSASRHVIVIDALDECKQEEDIKLILHLLAQTGDLGPVSLRIFVTSRPELHIRLGFKKMLNGTYQDLILHNIPKQTVKGDITRFLEHELGIVREDRSLSLGWPSEDQIQALVEKSNPLFIFAATACRYIADHRGNPKKRLEIILQYQTANQVSPIDKIYSPILNQLFNDEYEGNKKTEISDFQNVVGSIVVLESPLSIASLASLLKTPEEDISCMLASLHSVLNIPVNKDMPVGLLHLSFRDFLLDTQKRNKNLFWVDEKETHERLASNCLELLSSPCGLRQNMCHLASPATLRSEIDHQMIDNSLPTEVQYACCYWVHHLVQSGSPIRDKDLVHAFLQKFFLYWLEAMSLMGKASESIRMIKSLLSLIDVNKSAATFDFLRDGERFALRNRPILETAPLQLYSSALIFSPEMSIVRKTFEAYIPMWVARLPNVQKDWNALLQTHDSCLNSVIAVSPDDKLIASASAYGIVQLWDVDTGSCQGTLESHSESVTALAFSPDGKLVASASCGQTIRLWDAGTASLHSTLAGHLDCVEAVVFSLDGRWVASASLDRMIRLWDVEKGSCHRIFTGHSGGVATITFSPDGQLIASSSEDKTIRLWDVNSGDCRRTLQGHSVWDVAVSFSPDGKLIASTSGDSKVWLWDVSEGTCLDKLNGHLDDVWDVAFSPNGQQVASASKDGTIQLWNLNSRDCRILEGHSSDVRAIAFSPDGQLLASASYDKTIRLWDADNGSCRSTLEGHLSKVTAVAFLRDSQLLVSASEDKTVRLWDARAMSCRSTLESYLDSVNHVAFSPNGQLVASASIDNSVRLWNADTGSRRSTLIGHLDTVKAVVFSPDSRWVASASSDTMVRLWDVDKGSCHRTFEDHSKYITAVAFSPDSKLVVSGSGDATVRLWDVDKNCCYKIFHDHTSDIKAIAFSPDCQLVASTATDNTVMVWNASPSLTDGRVRLWDACAVRDPPPFVNVILAFSPDSQLVAIAQGFKKVYLWEHNTGQYRTLNISSPVEAVAFSSDGQLVASVSHGSIVRLWDAQTCDRRSTLLLTGNINTLSFSSEGSHLKTNRGNISIPPPPSGPLIRQKDKLPAVFVGDEWVAFEGQKFLWLPIDYRPGCTSVWGNLICIGSASGHLIFLEFDFEKL